MSWRFVLGGALGVSLSAWTSNSVSVAVTPPTLDIIMDPSKDIKPIQAVVVGGGYTGSRTAYMFDSVMNVTLIDEKNFFELSNDVIPIISNPWTSDNEEACRRLLILHRYYLKRSNVLTGTVDGVTPRSVLLSDGRTINYDLLFVSVGEQKSFPFSTKQRTITGRISELREFNHFLGGCKKVAIVGGGPTGTSLAKDLGQSRPDLMVDVFHSKSELVPTLPKSSRAYARQTLEKEKNITLHLSTRVTEVKGVDGDGRVISSSAAGGRSVWQRVTGAKPAEPVKYALTVEKLKFTPEPDQSILSQVYFGRRPPKLDSDVVESVYRPDDYDYVFTLCGDTPRPIVAESGKENILHAHQAADGHYRASTLMQLYGMPNVFAIGRCNNLPFTKGYGSSDIQARTMFRMISSVIHNPTERFLYSRDGVQPQRMQIPRMLVRLGPQDAVGATPWSGGMSGLSAVHEFMQDRNHLVKEFQKPIFYKPQDPAKVAPRLRNWVRHEITDIVDFSHC